MVDVFATLDDDSAAQVFRSLGYGVDWDYSRKTGRRWYEISKNGALFVQVDMGVPLAHIQQDFRVVLAGCGKGSPSDYTISGPESEELDTFMRRVVDLGAR